MTQTTTIKIDIAKPNIPVVVYAKQHDKDTRKVEASLYNNGVAFTIPASTSGQVNIAKPDGTGCYYDVDSMSGNVVTFTLVEQALAAAGTAKTEVSLFTTENDEVAERLTSFSFDIIIEKRAIEDSTLVSSDYYNALLDLSETVQRSVTFTPSVNSDGLLEWSNDGGLTNPESRNIKGPQGATGATGAQGYSITSVYAKSTSTADGGTSTYGVKNSNNVEVGTFSVKNGSKGSTGSAGASISFNMESVFASTESYQLPSNTILLLTVAGTTGTLTITAPSSGNCICILKKLSGKKINSSNGTIVDSNVTTIQFLIGRSSLGTVYALDTFS